MTIERRGVLRILGYTLFRRRGIVIQLGDNQGIVAKFNLRWYQRLSKVGKEVKVPQDAEVSPYVFSEFQESAAEMQGKTFCVKQIQLIRSGELSVVHKLFVDPEG